MLEKREVHKRDIRSWMVKRDNLNAVELKQWYYNNAILNENLVRLSTAVSCRPLRCGTIPAAAASAVLYLADISCRFNIRSLQTSSCEYEEKLISLQIIYLTLIYKSDLSIWILNT